MTRIFIHGTGHKAASWKETLSYMQDSVDTLCPDLGSILNGRDVVYENLYSAFAEYCAGAGEQVQLCGLSLGGVLALNYTLDFPERVESLVLIGTPHKVPKAALAFQSAIFRLIPGRAFKDMAFDKRGTFSLTSSLKDMDFSSRTGEVRCPTLIICGEKDRANIESARFLARGIKGAELRIIEGAGHVVSEERPEALAGVLTDFFRNVERH
ncbi:alpha/beta fold hydrolase [Acutalibacter sp. 1XD8-36]|uniref:alpha/beta fold hydrolase n=1 Tax=Acutalibacter sp. 1XD8-36 TaxID=2320852 RepID=UPI001412AEA6|nr:alpha/beta hydrolase [Acutalibacter sp. 1XD8-36]NBJ89010.1 alpha/beta fold hydrolase [Acutalibacter sp. 1XD8-36]